MSKYKGDLEGFPEEVVEAMLDYQEEQGNERDVTVFETEIDRNGFSGDFSGGFTWRDTPEGFRFWQEVLGNKNFDLYFDKYPKKEVKVKVEEKEDVKEPMRCRIDLGGGNKVEFLIDTLDINFDKGFIDIKAK